MDENGDAEGNYTLLTRRPHHKTPGSFGLYPAGTFLLSGGGWPVSFVKFNKFQSLKTVILFYFYLLLLALLKIYCIN
jgi:hypothetical protein